MHSALVSACGNAQLEAAACLIKHGADAKAIYGSDAMFIATKDKLDAKAKTGRRELVDRAVLASPLRWPTHGGGFDGALSAGVRRCWRKDRCGVAGPSMSLRRLAGAVREDPRPPPAAPKRRATWGSLRHCWPVATSCRGPGSACSLPCPAMPSCGAQAGWQALGGRRRWS